MSQEQPPSPESTNSESQETLLSEQNEGASTSSETESPDLPSRSISLPDVGSEELSEALSDAIASPSAESDLSEASLTSSSQAEPEQPSREQLSVTDLSAESESVPEMSTAEENVVPSAPTPEAAIETQPGESRPIQSPVVEPQSQTLQKLQEFWQVAQPKLKAGAIATLKTTIRLLEFVVERLEAEPRSVDKIPSGTEQPPFSQPSSSAFESVREKVLPFWQQAQRWWGNTLPKIRGVLPASVNEALSDRVLTGAIAGLLVLVLWTTSSLFSSKPPTQVATAPPSKSAPAKPVPTKEKEPTKKKPQPEVKVIPPAPSPSPKATSTPKPAPSPQVSPSPDTSKPVVEAPKPSPSPSLSPTPKPSPVPPPLKLTPEQALIARIQDQVAEVSNQYVNGLIQAVQANFRASRLTVKVGDGWYGLTEIQQDKLANDVLQRAQQLNFSKLELADSTGKLLARSPVVGAEMVVLKRSLLEQPKATSPVGI